MKRILISLGITFGLSIVVLYVSTTLWLPSRLQRAVEEKGSTVINGRLKVGKSKVNLWPIGVELSGLKLESRDLNGSIRDIRVQTSLFGLLARKIILDVSLIEPNLSYELPPKNEVAPPQKNTQQETSVDIDQTLKNVQKDWQIDLKFSVKDGQFKVNQDKALLTSLEDSQLLVVVPGWEKPVAVVVATDMTTPLVGFKLPLYFQSEIKHLDGKVDVQNALLRLMGIEMSLKGQYDLSLEKYKINIQSSIPQIASVALPKSGVCAQPQRGAIDVDLSIAQEGPQALKQIAGHVQLKNFELAIACASEVYEVNGQTVIHMDTKFRSQGTGVQVDSLVSQLQMKDLKIKYGKYFNKEKGQPFYADIDIATDFSTVDIKKAPVLLDKIVVLANGKVQRTGNGTNLNVTLNRTSLTGLEKMFPPLASAPVKGEMALKALIAGDINQPETLSVKTSPLELSQVEAMVNWQSEDKKTSVSGPVRLDALLDLDVVGKDIRSAKAKLEAGLSQLNIKSEAFVKPTGQNMSLTLAAAKKGEKIEIEQGSLVLPSGSIGIRGSLQNPQKPLLNLNFILGQQNVEAFLKLMPKFHTYKVTGTATGNLNLSGVYDMTLGIEKAQLRLSGSVSSNLNQVTLPAPPEPSKKLGAASGTQTAVKPPPTEAMLPEWPLYKNMSLNLQTKIQSFKRGTLTLQGLNSQLQIQSGVMLGTVQIANLFDGKLYLTKLKYPLLVKQPTTEVAGTVDGLEIQKAVTWFSEEWKDLVKGKTKGSFSFVIPDNTREDFLSLVSGNSQLTVTDGFLSTLKFDEMANEKISKIPGLSAKQDAKVKTGGAQANLIANFSVQSGKMNLQRFNAITPKKDELEAKGTVGFDKSLDLEGELHLASAPVKGSVREANSDTAGRFVVPIRIKGSVFSPDVDIAQVTVAKILENTAKLEVKRQGQKLGEKLGDDLKKEAEKKLKSIFK